MSTNDKLLDIKEAADILNVHWQTVRSYIKKGELQSHKVGRNVRIKKSDLDEFIEGKPHEDEKEVEIRFATKKRKAVEKKLLEMGAKVVYHGHVIDHWYVPLSINDLDGKDEWFESAKGYGLRIREQDNGYTGNITASIEVKRLAEPMKHEVCIETEFQIPDFESADNLLNLMNHKKMVTLDKDRLVYKINDIKVVIDDIKSFKTGIELEIMTHKEPKKEISKLKKFAEQLGLDIDKELTDKSVTYMYMEEFAEF